jgi:hypothetical protein
MPQINRSVAIFDNLLVNFLINRYISSSVGSVSLLIYFWTVGLLLVSLFNAPISFSQERFNQMTKISQESCIGYISKAESSYKQTQLETNSAKNQLLQIQQRQKQIQALVAQGAGSKSDLVKINQQAKQRNTELKQAIATENKAKEQVRSLRMMSNCAV